MTNVIIANVETLSHDDGCSYSFSSDGHQFGGHCPLAPWIRHWPGPLITRATPLYLWLVTDISVVRVGVEIIAAGVRQNKTVKEI